MRVGISVTEDELEEAAAFCRSEALGLEVTAFADPKNLDEDFDRCLQRHAEAVDGIPFLSLHGPFLDLYCTSPDPKVVELCRRRQRRGLEAARILGADLYVAHLNSIPLIRNERYRDGFASAAAGFWRPLAEDAASEGITIVLENMWEPSPGLQRLVTEAVDHPHLRASFDNGHGLVFSELTAGEWIAELGPQLAHLHLHDNDGEYDHHRAIGDGVEDWPALVRALGEHAPEVTLILESDRLETNRASLERLHRLHGRS